MKIFEKTVDGTRKFFGTLTNDVPNATEVTYKTEDGSPTVFELSGKHYTAGPEGTIIDENGDVVNFWIGDTCVIPRNFEAIDAQLDDITDEEDTAE